MNYKNNHIEENCYIEENVTLGVGNKILRNTIIYGPCEIGDNNLIGPNSIIGTPGQHTVNPRYESSNKKIKIGNNCIIREFSVVQKPYDSDYTTICDDVFIMEKVHIPHDAQIGSLSVLTPGVVLGGNTAILEGANLGINCSVHQNTVVGQYTMIGMGTVIKKNLKPFSLKTEGRDCSVNLYSLKKYGFMKYRKEIISYLRRDIMPTTRSIRNIIVEFEEKAKTSNRPNY